MRSRRNLIVILSAFLLAILVIVLVVPRGDSYEYLKRISISDRSGTIPGRPTPTSNTASGSLSYREFVFDRPLPELRKLLEAELVAKQGYRMDGNRTDAYFRHPNPDKPIILLITDPSAIAYGTPRAKLPGQTCMVIVAGGNQGWYQRWKQILSFQRLG